MDNEAKSHPYIDTLSAVLDMFNTAKEESEITYNKVGLKDGEKNDILHAFEMLEMTDQGRLDLVDRLVASLKERRVHKDAQEYAGAISSFLTTNPKIILPLQKLLDDLVDIQSRQATRTYRPRALPELFK